MIVRDLYKILLSSDAKADISTAQGVWDYGRSALAHIGLGALVGVLGRVEVIIGAVFILYAMLQHYHLIKDDYSFRGLVDAVADTITFLFGILIAMGVFL